MTIDTAVFIVHWVGIGHQRTCRPIATHKVVATDDLGRGIKRRISRLRGFGNRLLRIGDGTGTAQMLVGVVDAAVEDSHSDAAAVNAHALQHGAADPVDGLIEHGVVVWHQGDTYDTRQGHHFANLVAGDTNRQAVENLLVVGENLTAQATDLVGHVGLLRLEQAQLCLHRRCANFARPDIDHSVAFHFDEVLVDFVGVAARLVAFHCK